MKNIKTIAFVITLFLLTILVGVISRNLLTANERKIKENAQTFFKEAVLTQYNKRIKAVDSEHYYSFPITHNWPKEKIVLTTEEGEWVQTNIESIRALPIEEKIRVILEKH